LTETLFVLYHVLYISFNTAPQVCCKLLSISST